MAPGEVLHERVYCGLRMRDGVQTGPFRNIEPPGMGQSLEQGRQTVGGVVIEHGRGRYPQVAETIDRVFRLPNTRPACHVTVNGSSDRGIEPHAVASRLKSGDAEGLCIRR